MTKQFADAGDFVDFLRDNETIASILPFAEELVLLHQNINKGCNCKRGHRIATRDHVYKTMIENVISANKVIQESIKKYGGATTVIWIHNNKIILEI